MKKGSFSFKQEVDDTDLQDKQYLKKIKSEKQNQIKPMVSQAKDLDSELKQQTVKEMREKNQYAENLKPLKIPKKFKNRKSLLLGGDSAEGLQQALVVHNDKPSWNLLQNFINDNHPRSKAYDDSDGGVKKFGICDAVGRHRLINCGREQHIEPLARQIGIGSSLFLMATQALSWLFLFMTIIHIPVYIFYYNSNAVERTSPVTLGYFKSLSLGNIAQRESSCNAVNLAMDNKITLRCPSGKLENIMYYGFMKDNTGTCMNLRSATHPYSFFEQQCYKEYKRHESETSKHESERVKVEGELEKYYYDNCWQKSTCDIHIQINDDTQSGGSIQSGGSTSGGTKAGSSTSTQGNTSGSSLTGGASKSSGTKPSSGAGSSTSINTGSSGNTSGSGSGSASSGSNTGSGSSSKSGSSTSSGGSSSGSSKPSSGSTSGSGSSSSSGGSNSASGKPSSSTKAGGSARLLGLLSSSFSTVKSIKILDELSPICKSILQKRIYSSAFTSKQKRQEMKIKDAKLALSGSAIKIEPYLLLMTKCEQDKVIIKQGGFNINFKKEDLGIFVILLDFVVVIIFLYFVYFLHSRQEDYIEKFERETIEMTDFTLEFSNLPSEGYYDGKQDILRAKMWERLQLIMEDQLVEETGRECRQFEKMEEYNIIDITFATTDVVDIQHLTSLKNLYEELQALTKEHEILQDHHEHEQGEHSHKTKWDICPCCPGNREDRAEQQYKKVQAQYIKEKEHYRHHHAEHLKSGEISTQNELTQEQKKKQIEEQKKKRSITKAYVVFRSMSAVNLITNAYKYSTIYRYFIKLMSYCCCRERYIKIRQREFQGRWPDPKTPDLPDNIQWQNMAVIGGEKYARKCFSWAVSVLIIILAFIFILFFKQLDLKVDNTKFKLVPTKYCHHKGHIDLVASIVDKTYAYDDYQLPVDQQKGLMSCYCYNILRRSKYNYSILEKINFADLTKNSNKPLNLCDDWLKTWLLSGFCKTIGPLLALGINIFVPITINKLSEMQMLYTRNDQTMQTFLKVTFLSFFNVAIVILLVNFRLKIPILNEAEILVGEYTDFSEKWYQNIGSQICVTLTIMIITPQISKLLKPFKYLYFRLYDRKWSFKTQASGAENEDDCNTRQLTQDKINDLYLGPEIEAFFIYAQQFTSLWCIMTYSSGLPILYPIGCANFFVLYYVYKFLLIKFYSKTKAFNHQLPQTAIHYFKISIIFHVLVAMWVYSNSNILSQKNTKQLAWLKSQLMDSTSYVQIEKYPFMQRFIDGVGLMYFLFSILILGLVISQMIATTLFERVFKVFVLFITCGGEKGRLEELDEQQIEKQEMKEGAVNSYSENFVKDLKIHSLHEFYNRTNEELDRLENNKDHFVSEDTDSNVDLDLYNFMLKKMRNRKKNIHQVFEQHIKILTYETGKENERFLLNLKPEDQLMFIETNTTLIVNSLSNTDSFRMEGVCQSYNLYDSVIYRDLNFMKNIFKQDADEDEFEHIHKHDHSDEENKDNSNSVSQNQSKQELIYPNNAGMIELKGKDNDPYVTKQNQIKPGSVNNLTLLNSNSVDNMVVGESALVIPEYGVKQNPQERTHISGFTPLSADQGQTIVSAERSKDEQDKS